ncbi:L-2-hydroxyglutarate oxidase LhgO [Clostridium acetobutylicum]|uniref:Predicted dehydrogenase with iron-sulfur domain n=1 Tax=Clostridium acetobutylicum (strain ATCC 824 / DSM 792 / JCM 1419 / IAM 19013 / LMG 5710 / NBRC 13948 / NRRL B-527 / VKM B-1787 / 2291 / W) TaxID=272562 RepID=Q97N26_CLOAB|nr:MULTISPECIES: NAD(P)/FAD-dependent oxidoreductase [Clostridium]AAK77999.1 Predicted dehydrogenase with iron-sulfur domain [Clostridium acetobutylicum ATCC 824]ADZ19055.1 dehydrogenase with iron-sulfur domain [Clostridium acetobutylicum EA 2018]AEI31011.1 dehydrogenase [Clostridium acetobutylicum DSM 1731]AWV81938.1 NAD(P)/FAD-dependent oxidoreductase [Clostridium acetobutylicum]MBC2395488.1 NAD(P)/FAD-dependent oxidoreductase [Clostridium acetobutylicum]
MDYDVLILGGGIIGCSIAYELSKYSLNVSLIEKEYEIGDDTSIVNSDLVYDGIESKYNFNYGLETEGNQEIEKICSVLSVPFKKVNAIVCSRDKENEDTINKIYSRGIKRGIKDASLANIESAIAKSIILKDINNKGIELKDIGIVCADDLALAYGEVAFDNGVNFRLNEKVIEIKKISKGFNVTTSKNKFTCKIVINTIPDASSPILVDGKEDKGSKKNISNLIYFVLDRKVKASLKHAIAVLSNKGDSTYIFRDFEDNIIVKIVTKDDCLYDEALDKLKAVIGDIEEEDIIYFYKSRFINDKIVITNKLDSDGYIKVQCKSYAISTVTPSISRNVGEAIVKNLNCKLKKEFYGRRREIYRFRDMSNKQRQKLIATNPDYGKIICRCNQVTEGEIIDSIRRPLGARTLNGIKRRTGVFNGECLGTCCIDKIVKILAKETNKSLTEVIKKTENSSIVKGRIKEFDEM